MARHLRDWSTLPNQIIQIIAELLEARLDILRMRAVCSSFRSAIPPPILCSPHLKDLYYDFLPPPLGQEFVRLAIKQYTFYLIEPISEISACTSIAKRETTTARLIKVRESDNGKVRLLDPFTSLPYRHLNHMLPECLNLSDYRVTEIAKEYGLEYADDCERLFCRPRKVSGKVAVSNDHGDELVLMTLVCSNLHMWSSGNKEWVHLSDFGSHRPRDIVYHNGKFYVLTAKCDLLSVDPKTLKKYILVMLPRPIRRPYRFKSFVKSGKDLFMVTKTFKIYKFEEEMLMWEELKDGIGDNALFMIKGGNFFVSAKEFNVFKRNCIYLPGGGGRDFDKGYPGKGAKIFSFEDGSKSYLTAFPVYSDIFWPPSTWPIPKCEDYESCSYKNLIS